MNTKKMYVKPTANVVSLNDENFLSVPIRTSGDRAPISGAQNIRAERPTRSNTWEE